MDWINLLLIFVILAGVLLWLLLMLRKNPSLRDAREAEAELLTIEALQSYATAAINEFTNANLLDLGLSAEEFERRRNVVAELKSSLKTCNSGSLADKTYVKSFIADLLLRGAAVSETTIDRILPFGDARLLSDQDKFDILLHVYKLEHGMQALSALIERYSLAELKSVIENGSTESYIITAEEIREIYEREAPRLSFEDKLQIVVQRIYQQYKGFGAIDELRDQTIDGVSGGVSGLPGEMREMEDEVELMRSMREPGPRGCDSVWIFYRGKSIRLAFLGFGSDLELKRVCQNIYKFGSPGQLSEAKAYMVNEMQDGSRVVVVRPPFSESWAFFVRKFDLPNLSLERLLASDRVTGAELPMQMLDYLMKGAQVTAVTGEQGSGKTTLLMAMVKSIYGTFNLRIQELAFELHLRRLYPERNTLAFRETDKISGQEGLDLQKKTDGTVNILGEVATDPVAAWAVQMSQVASKFTVFSHHAKTMKDLIWSLRNSLLKTGTFQNERIAEEQVASVIAFDVHLEKERDGTRYIQRLTECVVIDPDEESFAELARLLENGADENAALKVLARANLDYYRRLTGRTFEARSIIEFRDGAYVPVNRPTPRKVELMAGNMSKEDEAAFRAFLDRYWGSETA
ncbi:ATPase, T2SS/T4P/T4SS family [Saccharibacillus alkalitolerans]|uniref:Flp pilus assembly complex ATPase component n=1 Tax=Saccharibacillus alkalitolerans TaxID=2705290 RepID=A0ABX0F0H2_9BACL|nr:ATPase, T2SS/T4P/T4SS family [Saccharibacillus alkalitolerans]NGZ74497.1 Flp pilus assembly complex ATPase component [Saccharibacillus alkalitolerans]